MFVSESIGGLFLAELHEDAKPKIQVLYLWKQRSQRTHTVPRVVVG